MEIRLNKFLSESGVCSRREADRLIESGQVTVDGKRAEMGMKVTESQTVRVGKKVIRPQDEMVLLAVNKPVGIVCTEEKKEKNNIIQFLKYPTRITYIGRLDKDSEGLLLMTNNGDIINKMMRAGNQHEKEYKVTVNKPITVAVMGCIVNGPGEAKEADIGLAGGKGKVALFRKGEVLRTVDETVAVEELMKEIEQL